MTRTVLFLISLLSAGLACASDFATIKQQAEHGDAAAQFDLGTLYDLGEGVPRDLEKAAKWYRQAAEQGEVAAQYNLAIMYDLGEGVAKDIVQAYAWMAAAEMYGYQGARETSKDFLVRMTAQQREQGDAMVVEIVNRINSRQDLFPVMKPGTDTSAGAE